uniref:Amino acid transporter transmembrane domain-containing protein n=1 Tax=Glossina brevipalpis TaxID=37001 RepID=A0A1A9W4N6_9MUSC
MEPRETAYDPYKYRGSTATLGYWGGLLHLVNCILGGGILSGPFGFKRVGWAVGLIVSAIVMFLIVSSFRLLVKSINEVSRRRKVPYMQFGRAMMECLAEGPDWAKRYRKSVSTYVSSFLVIFHFGVGTMYIDLVTESVKDLIVYFLGYIDYKLVMLMLAPFLIAISMIKTLKSLIPVSFISNISVMISLTMIGYYMFAHSEIPFSDLLMFNDFTYIPLYIGLVLLSNSSLGVLIAIESEMKDPARYLGPLGCLNVGMFLLYILFALFSFCGYWGYGEDTRFYVIDNIPEEEMMSALFPEEARPIFETSFRVIVVAITMFACLLIPHFDIIISLVASVCLCILGISLPGIMDMCLKYPDNYGRWRIVQMRDIFLISFGFIACLAGIVNAGVTMYYRYTGEIRV